MFCILVFRNYHVSSSSSCVPLFWVLRLKVLSKCNCLVIYTRVLAKSRSICRRSSYATTSSYLIQVFPWSLPFCSPIKTIGLSSSHKDISYLFASRTPQSPSTPKSGNVCGRRYTVCDLSLCQVEATNWSAASVQLAQASRQWSLTFVRMEM